MPFNIPVVNLAIPDKSIGSEPFETNCELLLIVDQEELELQETKTLLENIVKYIGLPLEKTKIIGLQARKSIRLLEVLQNAGSPKIMIFGISLDRLHANLEVKPYQPKLWLGRSVFFSHSLRQLETNVRYKKELFTMINTYIK